MKYLFLNNVQDFVQLMFLSFLIVLHIILYSYAVKNLIHNLQPKASFDDSANEFNTTIALGSVIVIIFLCLAVLDLYYPETNINLIEKGRTWSTL